MSKTQNQMPSKYLLTAELIGLFLLLPGLLALPIVTWVKLSFAAAALIYLARLAHTLGLFQLQRPTKPLFCKETQGIWLRVLLFMIASTILMVIFYPDAAFYVVRNNPGLWLLMSVVYCLVSVIPQEFIYRRFFFLRYQGLFVSQSQFVLLNAVLFCCAHLFFYNALVLALTFAGGLLFASNYSRNQSLWYVFVEHSAYGLWLFTLGMGSMLAFPGGPES